MWNYPWISRNIPVLIRKSEAMNCWNRWEADRRVLKLSGGQQQRVAITRALSYEPDFILADEPTGNLDGETQNEIMAILRGLAAAGKCIIIVNHSPSVAQQADVIYRLTPVEAV